AGGPAGQPGEAEVLRVGEQAGAVVLGAGGQGAEIGEHETQARPEGPGPASGDHVVVAGARAPPGSGRCGRTPYPAPTCGARGPPPARAKGGGTRCRALGRVV